MVTLPMTALPVFAAHGPKICTPFSYKVQEPLVPTVPHSSSLVHVPVGRATPVDATLPETSFLNCSIRPELTETLMIGPSPAVRKRIRLPPSTVDVRLTCSEAHAIE